MSYSLDFTVNLILLFFFLFRQKEFGGGAVLDLGVYPAQLALLVFGKNTPYEIYSAGHLNDNKVDDSYTCIIKYPEGKTATLILHTVVKLENDAYIYGTKGFIKVLIYTILCSDYSFFSLVINQICFIYVEYFPLVIQFCT